MTMHSPYQAARGALGILRRRLSRSRTQVRCPTLRLGNRGARWCVNPDLLSRESIVYSFGVGEDISFDLELIRRFGVIVHAFDPTPRSIRWITRQSLPEQLVFHDYGVADFDGEAQFFAPENCKHVSHSLIRRNSGESLAIRVYRLQTIMRMLGHDRIDVLKIDIEGAEYALLPDLLASGIRVQQLLVEFHHRWPQIGRERTQHLVRVLNGSGYQIFDISPSGEEYSFIAS